MTQDLHIVQHAITQNFRQRRSDIEYIVLHYTAGTTSRKGISNCVRSQFERVRGASADYVVDDYQIVQCNPNISKYCTYHVGDGRGRYGITNDNSIGIEMCSTLLPGTSRACPNHPGWSITEDVLERTLQLILSLMRDHGVPISHVVRHYDASRKACPGLVGWNKGHLYTSSGRLIPNLQNNEDAWMAFHDRLANLLLLEESTQ